MSGLWVQSDLSTLSKNVPRTEMTCRIEAAKIDGEESIQSRLEKARTKDQEITFILTHAGANLNGDVFTVEELKASVETIVGKKVNLNHDQEAEKVVGKVQSAEYVDEDGGFIRCKGVLFTSFQQLAFETYGQILHGTLTNISNEAAFKKGVCSICGFEQVQQNQLCIHLKEHLGGSFNGKPVQRTLHDVRLDAASLLAVDQADPGALVESTSRHQKTPDKETTMNLKDEKKKEPRSKAAKDEGDAPETKVTETEEKPDTEPQSKAAEEDQAQAPVGSVEGMNEEQLRALVGELNAQLDELKRENASLRDREWDLKSELSSAKDKLKAQKVAAIMQKMRDMGVTWDSDQAEKEEADKFMKMSDAELAAVEIGMQIRAPKTETPPTPAEETNEPSGEESDSETPVESSKQEPAPTSQSALRQRASHVPDGGTTDKIASCVEAIHKTLGQ